MKQQSKWVGRLVRLARGANFVEYMVLVALAIGAVALGAKTLGSAMDKGTKEQSKDIEKGFAKSGK